MLEGLQLFLNFFKKWASCGYLDTLLAKTLGQTKIHVMLHKRLRVAYTHVHAYMWAPVPQGSLRFFCVLHKPDVNIRYITRVVEESVVMHQSRCLVPEVKVAGSLVTGNGFLPS